MNSYTKNLLLIATGGFVAIACRGASSREASPGSSEPARPAQNVATALVTRGLEATVWAPARIRARQEAVISSRVSATVLSMPFREGDPVRAGETLVRLDDIPQKAAVTAAEVALASAESENRRITNLLKKDAATPREAEAVAARLAGARAGLASARDLLAATAIRAPFDGRIVSKSVNPGDVANPGAPLLELQGGTSLELVATLEPSTASSLRVGQELKVSVDGVGMPLKATVHSIGPAADPTTHRVDVLCNLGQAGPLKAGLFAQLELPRATSGEPGTLSVPQGAVLKRGGLTGVFAVNDGRAWLRWIAVGRGLGDRIEVRAGLVEGERVVIGPAGLSDGAAIVEARQ